MASEPVLLAHRGSLQKFAAKALSELIEPQINFLIFKTYSIF